MPNAFLTSKEVCALLSISRPTLERMVKDGRLPRPAKLGTSKGSPVRFDPEKIKAAVERQSV
jgi:excisionase family DNA binding protein